MYINYKKLGYLEIRTRSHVFVFCILILKEFWVPSKIPMINGWN